MDWIGCTSSCVRADCDTVRTSTYIQLQALAGGGEDGERRWVRQHEWRPRAKVRQNRGLRWARRGRNSQLEQAGAR